LQTPHLKAPVGIDTNRFASASAALSQTFHKAPTDAELVLNGTTVSTSPDQNGYDLDTTKLASTILTALDHGQTTVTVPVQIIKPKVTATSLKGNQHNLEEQLDTQLTLSYNGQNKQIAKVDIAGWYTRSGTGYQLSDVSIGNYLVSAGQSFGIHVKDISQTTSDIASDIYGHKSTTVVLSRQLSVKTYHYCTALKGVDASVMPSLQSQLAATYNDVRGWSLGGLIDFEPATNGCDFTVWLVAADLMPTFGSICDPVWNCEPGGNMVVLNYDRWTQATGPWLAVYPSGNIAEYRAMAINHETGHQLGFGHQICTTPGQPSPVMQQESIDLHGCTFNAWPLPSELAALKQRLGL
jgi:hypothetical protein